MQIKKDRKGSFLKYNTEKILLLSFKVKLNKQSKKNLTKS